MKREMVSSNLRNLSVHSMCSIPTHPWKKKLIVRGSRLNTFLLIHENKLELWSYFIPTNSVFWQLHLGCTTWDKLGSLNERKWVSCTGFCSQVIVAIVNGQANLNTEKNILIVSTKLLYIWPFNDFRLSKWWLPFYWNLMWNCQMIFWRLS